MTEFLDMPGGRLAYDLTGQGPLVVCVPGMGDIRATFRHLVPRLAQAGYRVATMDLRGTASPAPAGTPIPRPASAPTSSR